MTTPVNYQNGNNTSVNPANLTALWHLPMTAGWSDGSNQTTLYKSFLDTIEPLKGLTPGGGCYVNEGHFLDQNGRRLFTGTTSLKCPRLRRSMTLEISLTVGSALAGRAHLSDLLLHPTVLTSTLDSTDFERLQYLLML